METNPFVEKIKWYWYYRRTLSIILLVNLFAFALLRDNFFSIFYYCFLLFFAGNLLVQQMNNAKLITSYIIGFLSGGAIYTLWLGEGVDIYDNVLFLSAMQSAVWTMLVSVTFFNPNYAFKIAILPSVKLKYITILFIILNLLSIVKPEIYLSHLGACVIGALYGFSLTKRFAGFFKFSKKRKARMKAEYNPDRPLTDDEYKAIKAEKQKKVDGILDKISKNGYESLSKEEKDFLFKFGK
ncbi:MAG: hypothetical protein PHT69_15920 [Bacteroidales bacterium]|nr:hypothetical protein [Bacteroidales bacterium]